MLLWFRGSLLGSFCSEVSSRKESGCGLLELPAIHPRWPIRTSIGKEINCLSGTELKRGLTDTAMLSAISSGDENGSVPTMPILMIGAGE